jgi:hypothetical protein
MRLRVFKQVEGAMVMFFDLKIISLQQKFGSRKIAVVSEEDYSLTRLVLERQFNGQCVYLLELEEDEYIQID